MKKNKFILVVIAVSVIIALVAINFTNNRKDKIAATNLQKSPQKVVQADGNKKQPTINKLEYKVVEAGLYELPNIINSLGPTEFDVLAYMSKDKKVVTNPDKINSSSLINKRYDLKTPEGTNIAIADMYELLRLCGTEYYSKICSKQDYLTFIDATIEEILKNNADNLPVLLLKSRVQYASGNTPQAIETFEKACASIGHISEGAPPYSELVLAANDLLNSQDLSTEQQERIKSLVYQSGLSKNCILGKYLGNTEASDVGLNYLRSSLEKDPFDLSKSREFFKGIMPDEFVDGTRTLPDLKEIPPDDRFRFAAWRFKALSIEQDARGLAELSNYFKGQGIDKELVLAAQATAYRMSGLTNAAIDALQQILKSEDKKYSDMVLSTKYQLAVIFYEQGNYSKSMDLIRQCPTFSFLEGTEKERFNRMLTDLQNNMK